MLASMPHDPTDFDPDERTVPRPFSDIAQAVVGAAITSAPAIAAIQASVRSAAAVVQPALSGWLRIAAHLCRFR